MSSIILFNKPFRVLSQFSDKESRDTGSPRATLADFFSAPDYRVAGRLDYDSEGLLVLTNDGRLQQRIANPQHKQWKTYWVQVEGSPDNDALNALARGMLLKDGPTLPAKVRKLDTPAVWPRTPPIRERKSVPDTWLEISIREGRNRQVRRMTAAVGAPTLRLIRVAVGDWRLDSLAPGSLIYRDVPEPDPSQTAAQQKPGSARRSNRTSPPRRRVSKRKAPTGDNHE